MHWWQKIIATNARIISVLKQPDSFRSLKSGDQYFYNSSYIENNSDGPSFRGWGKCMKSSMDKLFDDWEDDPVGTFGCWVLSPFCVVGAGLGCAIKEISK
ncbi:MAG: hypothetical protein WD431_05970 [Cyclobacteriaceae bacterium]